MTANTAARQGPRVRGADGVDLATYHLGGDGPPVLLVHATGFHGRCWLPLAPALAGGFSVWALDQRGHGSSGPSPDQSYEDWHLFAEDLLAVVDALGLTGLRGVGHSLGGAVLLLTEQARPGTFEALYLYEPIVFGPDQAVERSANNRLSQLSLKRRNVFASLAEARDNYAGKPPFNRFDPAALDAYVSYGFVEQPDGTLRLACPGEEEASVYRGALRHRAFDHLTEVRPPVILAGGGAGGDIGPEALAALASRLPRATVAMEEGLSHFGPMEAPARLGGVIAGCFGQSTKTVTPSR